MLDRGDRAIVQLCDGVRVGQTNQHNMLKTVFFIRAVFNQALKSDRKGLVKAKQHNSGCAVGRREGPGCIRHGPDDLREVVV